MLSGLDPKTSFEKVKEVWLSGQALEKFKDMCKYQFGDLDKFQEKAEEINAQLRQNGSNIFVYKAEK